ADAALDVVIADGGGEVAESRQVPQGACLVAETHVFLIGGRPGHSLHAGLGDDADEAVRVFVDVRGEHHAVDHGEDAGINADADGEGEDHDEGEKRIAADDEEEIAYVLP